MVLKWFGVGRRKSKSVFGSSLARCPASQPPTNGLTRVLVQCRDDGCNVLIAGHGIHVFDLEFDRFAERNGFRHAIVGGDSGLRTVWLPR